MSNHAMIYIIKPLAGFAALPLIFSTADIAEKPDTFRPLFDGKSLDG